jgi:MoaA/NifB/PqqE/SkfB family radical SAM enzyme
MPRSRAIRRLTVPSASAEPRACQSPASLLLNASPPGVGVFLRMSGMGERGRNPVTRHSVDRHGDPWVAGDPAWLPTGDPGWLSFSDPVAHYRLAATRPYRDEDQRPVAPIAQTGSSVLWCLARNKKATSGPIAASLREAWRGDSGQARAISGGWGMSKMNARTEDLNPAVELPRPIPPQPGGNYVMQGSTADRALDTYHLILAPTHACNLRCKHCYLPDHAAQLLPEEVALRLVDEWGDITLEERGAFRGIFHVKGGEPFVVPYLGKIMDRLVALQSLRLMLTTNGTFTSTKVLESLRACNEGLSGHVTVIVSLDGSSAATHDVLRGSGQFAVTITFLRALQNLRIHTHLNCVLHTENTHEVPSLIKLAKDLGVEQINFLPLVPKGYGAALRSRQAPHLRLHAELQIAYDSGDEATKRLLAGSLSHILDRERNQGIPAAHECVAAYRGLFYITPEGSAFTCPNLLGTEHSIGDVRTTSLRELCDRLPWLYWRLRGPDSPVDRGICTGERVLYEKTGDKRNLESLLSLRRRLDSDSSSVHKTSETAYCVSRNF